MGTLETTAKYKSEAIAKLFAANVGWIQTTPGFRFLDCDGDEMIVIGWGGMREFNSIGRNATGMEMEMVMIQPTLVGANLYKGEWYLRDIPNMERLEECRPVPHYKGRDLCNCRDSQYHSNGCINLAAENNSSRCKGCDSSCKDQ